MGDNENALPPSKKRAAGRELTRDTPIDDEEDAPELEPGTFKRASDEVLATRRIVKVRRQPTNSAPSSNPFAGIRLTGSTESSAKPPVATTEVKSAADNTVADDPNGIDATAKDAEKDKDVETKQSESKTDEVEEQSTANKDTAAEGNAETTEKESTEDKPEVDEQREDINKNENEDEKNAATKETASEVDIGQTKADKDDEKGDKKENTDNEDKKDNKAENAEAEGGHLKSFQQLSSSQNAFTGLSGSGFSASSFSFGSIPSGEGSGSSIFGTKTDKPFGLGLSTNGNSSVFGASGASAISKSEGSGFGAMPEVVVETGEENEKVVFNADSVLFEFVDGSWKERGKGELKVNVASGTEDGSDKKARLLMRSRGNYRLIMNARLFPDMKLANMDKKGVTFACINSATEGKSGLSTFALKFKDVSIVEEFKAAVMEHKGAVATSPVV